MRRILLTTLLLATVTVAEPALQSRPPGLDLSGARIAALDEKVRQAEQAIADKRLTKGGRGGPAAQALLEGVLTADPFQPAALAAMERLIQALMAHAQDKLAAATPDLEGARDYWTKARDLVVAWRVSGSTAALDELRLAIDSRELAPTNRNYLAGLMDMAPLIALLLLAASLFGLARTGLAKRLAKAGDSRTTSQSVGRIALRSQPRTLGDSEVTAMLTQRGYFDRVRNEGGKGLANDFVDNGNGTVTDRATGLMWQQGGSAGYMRYAKAEGYVEQINRERYAGYDDWRLPTLEEAASLLEPKELNGDLYIDPVFDATQHWIWTADKREGSAAVWSVSFDRGGVLWFDTGLLNFVRVCRASGQ